ncbi:MAG: SpoIID/LytB domain-containing protein [Chloroflexi bacterium]|nr:SpoIID/LytB domain-containing protein [Chloroflexota bacterium]
MSNNETVLTLPTAIRVLLPNNQVEEMKLETYLAGVLAAEIGADAPLEALKAQAVASRTYVVAAQRHPEHNADVCTTAHCQKWKRVDPVSAPEVFRALSETWGVIAMHEGQLISAFFFEHCDGHTRNAEEMHVPALAYLRGVDCSCGFLTLKGHGVGMCKRGAIVMARRNASFEQILQHYYRGVAIIRTGLELPADQDASDSAPIPIGAPVAPKPRARRVKTPPEAAPRPRRRVTRRAQPHEIEELAAPTPVIEITAVPASVALKRVQITPAETQVVAPEPTPPAPAPSVEEKTMSLLIVPGAPAAPSVETTLANEPSSPRLELDLPIRPPTPVEPTPQGEPAAEVSWRLVKPEPIESAHAMPAPLAADDTPSMIGRRVHVDHLPGARMICGALPRANVVVMIENSRGENTIVYSGTAPQYGEGGFELAIAEDGKYAVTIGGQLIDVEVQSDTVFICA